MLSAAPSSVVEGVSAGEPLSDDWLSCFDFSDLPPAAPLTQVDLPDLLDLDCTGSFDIFDLLAPRDNPPSFDITEENLPFFNISEGLSSISEPDKADGGARQFEFAADTPSLHSSSSAISSPHNSDAGSSMVVAEGASFLKDSLDDQVKGLETHGHTEKNSAMYSVSSSRKRQHEDICSDMEAGDGEDKSQLDPLDKRQQRLLRNRELASESRQRKKCYVSDLEVKCKMLEQERNQLQQQVCFSAAENAVLKEELTRMKKMQGKDGVAEPAVLFKDSLPLEFLSLLICLLLMARLSLCASPFLALVLRAVVHPQSLAKGERLLKGQVNSRRCSHYVVDNIQWPLTQFWFHKPFRVYGFFMAGQMWQVPFLPLKQSVCKFLDGAIT